MRVSLLTGMFAAALNLAMPANAALIHDYNFTNGLTDALGGAALQQSFTAGGSGAAAGGLYTFTPGGGLALFSELPGSVYTIELRVALDQTSGYRKLVSFENITSDLGLYNLNGGLNLFNVANSATATDFVAGTFVNVAITRDASGLVSGYTDGVLRLTYNDTGNVFTAANALYFLRDDLAQNAEQSGGVADFIRIYDDAVGAVPEPTSWALMIGGFALVGGAMRRRVGTVAHA